MPQPAGHVHAVTGFLVQHDFNIIDSQQLGDPSKKFFMRVHFAGTNVKELTTEGSNVESKVLVTAVR